MVPYDKDPQHFVDLGDVAQVDAVTRVTDVFNILSGRTTSIVVVQDKGKARWYVNGRKLAEEFLSEAQNQAAVYDLSIGDFIAQHVMDSELVMKFSPRRADILASAAPAIRLGSDAPKRNLYCVTRGKVLEGVLFSHETFRGDAFTPPPKFICAGNHANPDPDHGRCRRCPRKIVSVQ
jgi:hypothetical protein